MICENEVQNSEICPGFYSVPKVSRGLTKFVLVNLYFNLHLE
jgi:hypothetical protein